MKFHLDVRWRWECPECGRTVKRHGDITSLTCDCGETAVSMRLVEPQRDFRPYQAYLVPEVEADELIGDEEPAPEKAAPSDPPIAADEVAQAVLEVEPAEPKSPDAGKPTDPPTPANAEIADPPPQEPPASEAASPSAKTGETTEASNQTSEEKSGRKGKRSRRRRPSRKRSRRRGSQGGKKGE